MNKPFHRVPAPLGGVLRASLLVWGVAVVALGFLWSLDGVLGCPPFVSDSDYGDPRWRWSALANACVYQFAGGTHIDEPGPARWGEVVLLVAWMGLMLAIAKAVRPPRPH
jgi:hypothetical protein